MESTWRNKFAVGLGIVLVSFALWHSCRKRDAQKDANATSTVLGPGMVKKFIVNPATRQLTVVTQNHEQKLFVPDRPSTISIDKAGQATVAFEQMGTELRPFVGFQLSNQFRIAFGIDAAYWKKMDFGVGLAGKVGMYTPVVFAKASYFVYDNTQLGITFDSSSHVGAILVVRL